MTNTTHASVRSFQVHLRDEDIVDLRQRIGATRWSSKEMVADRSQGLQLATMQELARCWGTEYEIRRFEHRLNALPQFKTESLGHGEHKKRIGKADPKWPAWCSAYLVAEQVGTELPS